MFLKRRQILFMKNIITLTALNLILFFPTLSKADIFLLNDNFDEALCKVEFADGSRIDIRAEAYTHDGMKPGMILLKDGNKTPVIQVSCSGISQSVTCFKGNVWNPHNAHVAIITYNERWQHAKPINICRFSA